MERIINKDMDQIKKAIKKERNLFIKRIIVLLCGAYCVIYEEYNMFIILGWVMITAGTLPIFWCYLLPKILFVLRKLIYKCRKRKYIKDI